MIKVVGVRFRTAGKIYYFDPQHYDIKLNDFEIVETAMGVEYGKVMIDPTDMPDDKFIQPLKPVILLATPERNASLRLCFTLIPPKSKAWFPPAFVLILSAFGSVLTVPVLIVPVLIVSIFSESICIISAPRGSAFSKPPGFPAGAFSRMLPFI